MLISSLHELLAEELLWWIGLGLGIEIPQNVTQHQYLDTLIWIRHTHSVNKCATGFSSGEIPPIQTKRFLGIKYHRRQKGESICQCVYIFSTHVLSIFLDYCTKPHILISNWIRRRIRWGCVIQTGWTRIPTLSILGYPIQWYSACAW